MKLRFSSVFGCRTSLASLLRHTAILIAGLGCSTAATLTWNGGGGDYDVSNGANWSTNTAPSTGDALVFAGSSWLLPTLSWDLSVASLTFNSTASPFVLQGNGAYTLTTSAGIVNNSTQKQTINNSLVFGANQTWGTNAGQLELNGNIDNSGYLLTVSHASGTTTLNGVLGGTGGLTKSGGGTLALNGANTYSGVTTLGGGTVIVGNHSAFGTGEVKFNSRKLYISATAGDWSLANTYTLDQNLTFRGENSLTLTGAGSFSRNRTLTVDGSGTLTLSGNLTSNNRSVTKAGSGTLVLSGSNTIGNFTHNAGTLYAGNAASLGSGTLSLGNASFGTTASLAFSNALTLAGNTTFVGSSSITFNGAAALGATRTLIFDRGAPVTFNGVISGAGFGITKSGHGTMVMGGTASNTFNGLTKVNDGQLTLAKTAGLNTFAGNLEIGDGSGASASAVVQLGAGNQIPDASTVSIFSDGQLHLQAFSDTVGTLTLYGGTVTGTGTLGLGGNLTFGGTGGATASISSSLAMTAARTFQINSNGLAGTDLTVSGGISGAFSATKTGAGNILLSGANTFSGGYSANAGSTLLGSSTALGSAAANLGDTSGANSASLLFDSAFSGLTVANAITVRSGNTGTITIGGLNSSGVNTFGGTLTLNKSVIFTEEAGGEVVFSGGLSGSGGFTKVGDGTIRLSNTNSSSGAMLISAGTLALGANSALGSGTLTINGGDLDFGANRTATTGAVLLEGDSAILGSGTSTLTSTGNFDLRSGLVQVALAGSGSFTKSTTGNLTLSGSNIYTGFTNITAGSLILGKANALPTNTTLTVGSGATLDLQGFATQTGSVTGSGSIQLGSATFTTGGNNTSTTFSGILSGSGGLTKSGTGTLTLSGANAYSGATTIGGGTLALGASNALSTLTTVTVNSGTFNLGTHSQTIAGLSGTGSAVMGGGTFGIGTGTVSGSFGGVISGTGTLVKSGTGTLTLSGTNTTTASLEIRSGSVSLQGASGTLDSVSSITLRNGGTLQLNNSSAENANRIGNSTSIRLDDGTLSLVSDGNGTLESVGSLVALGGASTVNVIHNGGASTASTLTFSGLGSIASGATVNFTATGGVLGASSNGPRILITGQTSGLLGSWATVGADAAEYFLYGIRAYSDYYEGELGININNTEKIVRLSGASAPGASTLTNAGITNDLGLNLTDIATVDLGTDGSRTLNLLNGSVIKSSALATTIHGSGKLTAGGTAAGNLNVSVTPDSSLTILSEISNNTGGAVGLSKGDSGTLTLGGSNTFTGNVFINDGVLSISSEANLGTANKEIVFNGGTLLVSSGFTSGSSKIIRVSSGLTGTLDIAGSQSFTLANSAGMLATGDSASTLVKSGAGTFVIQNSNTGFIGKLRLDQGITEVRHAASLGTGTVQLNGGSLTLVQNTSTAFNISLVMLADSTLRVSRLGSTGAVTHTLGSLDLSSGTLTITGDGSATAQFNSIILSGNGTLNNTTADLRAGAISGSFGLTKTGAGTLLLTASSSYTGSTAINDGNLRLTLANVIPDSSNVSLASGTTFDLAGFSETIGGLSGSGNITLGSATLTSGAGNFSGIISGTGSLVKTGTATTLTLSGANTYTGATTISAGTLAMGGTNSLSSGTALTVASGATFLLNGNATATGSLAGAGTVSLGSGILTTGSTSSTFSGILSGTGGLVKSGAGTLTLSGASTYSGSTTLQTGSIIMRSSSALGAAAGAVTVASGASLALENNISVGAKSLSLAGTGVSGGGALVNNSGSNSWAGTFTLASAATIHSASGSTLTLGAGILGTAPLTLDGAGSISLTGVLSGTSPANDTAIIKTGSGTSTLSGSNTYTGVTTVSSGTLIIANNTALGATGSGNGTAVSSGATLLLQPASGLTIGNESLILNGTGIGGNGALRSQTGSNTWTGSITLASASTVRIDSGSTLNLNGNLGESGGSRALTKDGTGTMVLSGLASTTGSLQIQGGTLQLGAAERLNDVIALSVSSGATFDLNNHDETIGSLTGSGSVTLGSDSDLGGGELTTGGDNDSATFSGVISGLGSLTKSGTGIQTLSGANSYTGITTLRSGVLSIASLTNGGVNSGIGAATSDAANLVLDGGTLRYTGATQATNRNYTIDAGGGTFDTSGTGTLTLSGAATMATANVARTLTLTGTNTGANTLGTALSDSGTAATSLIKSGTGTWVLGGANAYTGSTSVTAGILRLGSANRIGDLSAVSISSGASLDLNGFSDTIGSLSGLGNVTLGAGILTTGTNNASTTFGGVVSGTGSFTKTGTGIHIMAGNSSYSGMTSIIGGTLSVASLANGGVASGIGASTNHATNLLLNGGILHYTGATQTTDRNFTIGASGGTFESSGSGALTLAGVATLSGTNIARTLTLGGTNTGNNTYTTAITDNGSGKTALAKSGAGTWILKGTSTYTGTTSVKAGTLELGVGASLGLGAVTVDAGATLGNRGNIAGAVVSNGTITGDGSFASSVTINSVHRPGQSVGFQTFANGLAYASNAVLAWELANNTSDLGLGVDYDQVRLTGGVFDLAPGAVVNLSFDQTGSTVDFSTEFWAGNRSWSVVSLTGSSSAKPGNSVFSLGSISMDSVGNTYNSYGAFSTSAVGGEQLLTWTAIPEPGVSGLFLLGVGVLFPRRRG